MVYLYEMKRPIHTLYGFILLAFLFGGVWSCCPNKRYEETIEYKEGQDAAVMGFAGNETLTYLKNGKDTVRFAGTGLQSYYRTEEGSSGDCLKDYKYANRKVVFTNATEGDLVFRTENLDVSVFIYDVAFKKSLIDPRRQDEINGVGSIVLQVGGEKFNEVKPFFVNSDSVYLNVSLSDSPIYRLVRIKVDGNIYEVIML